MTADDAVREIHRKCPYGCVDRMFGTNIKIDETVPPGEIQFEPTCRWGGHASIDRAIEVVRREADKPQWLDCPRCKRRDAAFMVAAHKLYLCPACSYKARRDENAAIAVQFARESLRYRNLEKLVQDNPAGVIVADVLDTEIAIIRARISKEEG